VPEQQASHIFDQIAKFAGYGFNKSHAAAYALISYQTGWLKANYPVEFFAASMALDKGNTDELSVFKQELDRLGISLVPPDINKSGADFEVEDGRILYALAALKGVGEQAMQKIVAERDENGPYKDLFDLAERAGQGTLNKRQYEQLACAGAFDSIHPDRAQAHAAAELVLRYAQAQAEEKAAGQSSLFGGDAGAAAPPPPYPAVEEPWTQLEKLQHEFDAVGFYLSAHPLDAKAGQLARLNIVPVADVPEVLLTRPSALIEMAGVLMRKQIKVSPKSGNKYAFLQMSDASGVYEVTVFSETLARARDILEVGNTLLLKIVAEQSDEQVRYTVQDIHELDKSLSSKVRDIRIYLTEKEAAARLAEVLKGGTEGMARVRVVVDMRPGVRAAVALPGYWNFTPELRDSVSRVRGVADIRET
jgi:DNA polymerase-3 subunit alpha